MIGVNLDESDVIHFAEAGQLGAAGFLDQD